MKLLFPKIAVPNLKYVEPFIVAVSKSELIPMLRSFKFNSSALLFNNVKYSTEFEFIGGKHINPTTLSDNSLVQ